MLELSQKTILDWCLFCCEVINVWFHNPVPSSGKEVEIKIDEILIHRKYNWGCLLKQLWLFGGIKILTKCRLVNTLDSTGEKRNKATLITKYIKPGLVIVMLGWFTKI